MNRHELALFWYGSVLGGGVARLIDDLSVSSALANLVVVAVGCGLVWLYEHFRVVRADQ